MTKSYNSIKVYSIALLALCFSLSVDAKAQVNAAALPSFAPIVEKANPAIVNISTTQDVESKNPLDELDLPEGFEHFKEFFDRQYNSTPEGKSRKATSLGSGFIIDPAGYVVTNNHVIDEAKEISITLAGDDAKIYKAKVIGKDEKTDLALLKIETKDQLPFLTFGDSEKTKVGDWIVAIGNPFGFGGTVTVGIISAKARFIPGMYDDFLQTDAPINRGNSGGPMIDMEGNVIGVNSVIISPSGANVGIGLAIPSNIVKPIIQQLKEKGSITRGWLGVMIQTVTEDIANNMALADMKGALVSDVVKDGPAFKASIKIGDTIVKFDGKAVKDMKALPRMVAETEIGKKIKIEVVRDGKLIVLDITTAIPEGEADEKKGKPEAGTDANKKDDLVIGMKLENLSAPFKLKHKIEKDVQGAAVTKVVRNTPAYEAQIRVGDVIMKFNNKDIQNASEVGKLVADAKNAGAKNVVLLIKRGTNNQFVVVDLE